MSDGVEISSEEQERIDSLLCSDCELSSKCNNAPVYELGKWNTTIECKKVNEYEMMLTNSEPV